MASLGRDAALAARPRICLMCPRGRVESKTGAVRALLQNQQEVGLSAWGSRSVSTRLGPARNTARSAVSSLPYDVSRNDLSDLVHQSGVTVKRPTVVALAVAGVFLTVAAALLFLSGLDDGATPEPAAGGSGAPAALGSDPRVLGSAARAT